MPEPPLIIANLKYIKPQRRGRGQGLKALRGKLKYLQYREDREQPAPKGLGERWVNQGLGQHYRAIQAACVDLQSEHVLAWTWVISPAPDLLQRIPVGDRVGFLKDLSEEIVEAYYDARGVEAPYSYVVHQATTKDGRPHTHSHVMLPGTAWSALEGWQPFSNYSRHGHLQLLDDIAHDAFAQALDQRLGREWRQEFGLETGIPDDVGDLAAWFPR